MLCTTRRTWWPFTMIANYYCNKTVLHSISYNGSLPQSMGRTQESLLSTVVELSHAPTCHSPRWSWFGPSHHGCIHPLPEKLHPVNATSCSHVSVLPRSFSHPATAIQNPLELSDRLTQQSDCLTAGVRLRQLCCPGLSARGRRSQRLQKIFPTQ